MRKQRADIILMFSSILCLFIFSASFMLMPIDSEKLIGKVSIYSFIAGVAFWITFFYILITQVILILRMKKWMRENRIRQFKDAPRIGIFSFFRNTYAIIVDLFTLICLIGLFVSIIATQGTGYICYIFISLFVFSFGMHCILNGKTFYYVINQDELFFLVEKKKNSSV